MNDKKGSNRCKYRMCIEDICTSDVRARISYKQKKTYLNSKHKIQAGTIYVFFFYLIKYNY